MKKKTIIIIVVVLVLAVFLVATLKQDNTKAVSVQMEKVALRTLEAKVYAAGYVQPAVNVDISANVAGEIIELYVKEGQQVKKGDLLAQLDQVNYSASLDQAKSYYKSALSEKEVVEKDYKRAKALYENNNYSESQYDQAKASLEQAQAGLEQAEASLEQAQDNLRKTTLVAPIDGTVIDLQKEQGEMALGSTYQADVVMTIANLSVMEVEVDVNENDIVKVSLGDSVDIEIDALSDEVFQGVVTEISQMGSTTNSGTQNAVTNFTVIVEMIQNPKEIRSGMNATVEILTDKKIDVTSLPIRAVTVRSADKVKLPEKSKKNKSDLLEVVFVVEEDTVRAVPVELGISSEDYFEVLNAVDTNTTIVTGNHQALTFDLQNGTSVKNANDVKKKKK